MKSELEEVLNELAQYILYGEKNIQKAYTKEKIVQLDSNIIDINQIYKKFQKMEQSNQWRMKEEEIFYRQAKYLEKFECNYATNQTHRDSYNSWGYNNNATYEGFSFRDFKTYFSWRSKIRKGTFESIDYDYEQIYINELLNKIGCKDADEAIVKLIAFWKGYRQCELWIDKTMPKIMKEFYIVNTVNMTYAEMLTKYPIEVKTIAKDVKEIKRGIYTEKLYFFNEIATHKIAKSKLLETKYGYLISECIEKIFSRLHQEFERNHIALPDMLVTKNTQERYWSPLVGYAIYEEGLKEKEVIIEGIEKYEYKDEEWHRTVYSVQNRYKNMLGYIVKTMEYYIRDYLGYRKLKLPEKSEILKDIYDYYASASERIMFQKIYTMDLQNIIQTETLQYLKKSKVPYMAFKKKKEEQNEFEQEETIKISFNQEEFAKLREKSEEIQKALIIEEQSEEQQENRIEEVVEQQEISNKEVAKTIGKMQETTINTNDNVFQTFIYGLTKPEKEMIQILLQKQEVESKMLQLAQSQNEMLEVMVSNINDKALETIGDTIIESTMDSIYEDYENEIKQVL